MWSHPGMTWWSRLFGSRGAATSRGSTGADGAPGTGRSTDHLPAAAPIDAFTTVGLALPPLVSLGRMTSGVELRALRLPADDLLPWWHRVRAVHDATGYWPVLLGPDPGDLSRALPAAGDEDYDAAEQLASAATRTAAELHERRRAQDADLPDDAYADAPPPASVTAGEVALTVAREAGLLALVPAAHGWEVPAVLGWDGGCNYELEPSDHVVQLRDWHDRFGAELAALSGDQVMELLVARPPVDPHEALAVALEQYAYCPDVVEQGVGTVTALAADQVGSASWYFWWD